MKRKLIILTLAALAAAFTCPAQDEEAAAAAAWERVHNIMVNLKLRMALATEAAQVGRGGFEMNIIVPTNPPPDDTNDVIVDTDCLCYSGTMTFTGMKRYGGGFWTPWLMPRSNSIVCVQNISHKSSFQWTNTETLHEGFPSLTNLAYKFDTVAVEWGSPYFYTNGTGSDDVGTFTFTGVDQFGRAFSVSTNASMDYAAREATFNPHLHCPCWSNDPPLLWIEMNSVMADWWDRPVNPFPDLHIPFPDYSPPRGGGGGPPGLENVNSFRFGTTDGTNGLLVLVGTGLTNGMSYTLEWSASVGDDSSWSDAMTFTADDPLGFYVFSVEAPVDADARYYRLRQNP